MKVIDCIVKALTYLGLDKEADGLSGGTLSAEKSKQYLEMARDVVGEICCSFLPLKTTEKVVLTDGVVKYSALSLPVIDVFSVKSGGTSLPFVTKYDCIDIGKGGEVEIEYSFMPKIDSVSSVLPFSSKLSERVIGYGIAAEYCIIHRPAEAEMFDARYKDAIKKAMQPKNEKRISPRLWA